MKGETSIRAQKLQAEARPLHVGHEQGRCKSGVATHKGDLCFQLRFATSLNCTRQSTRRIREFFCYFKFKFGWQPCLWAIRDVFGWFGELHSPDFRHPPSAPINILSPSLRNEASIAEFLKRKLRFLIPAHFRAIHIGLSSSSL